MGPVWLIQESLAVPLTTTLPSIPPPSVRVRSHRGTGLKLGSTGSINPRKCHWRDSPGERDRARKRPSAEGPAHSRPDGQRWFLSAERTPIRVGASRDKTHRSAIPRCVAGRPASKSRSGRLKTSRAAVTGLLGLTMGLLSFPPVQAAELQTYDIDQVKATTGSDAFLSKGSQDRGPGTRAGRSTMSKRSRSTIRKPATPGRAAGRPRPAVGRR